jgi:hypothetical protein
MNRLADDPAQRGRITDLLDIGSLLDLRPGQLSGAPYTPIVPTLPQTAVREHSCIAVTDPEKLRLSSIHELARAKTCDNLKS